MQSQHIGSDLLIGAREIGRFLRRSEWAIRRLEAKGQLPGSFKWGGKLCALRSELSAGLIAKARRRADGIPVQSTLK